MNKRKTKTEAERETEALQPEDEGVEKHMTMRHTFAKAGATLHDEMLSIAKREARDGETPEQSLVRLIDQRDERIEKLYAGGKLTKQLGAQLPHDREQAEARMQSITKAEMSRTGQSEPEVVSRLLNENPEYRKAYAAYAGLA